VTKIKVRNGESLEQALRRFNREVLRDGVIKELKKRERYEKPSLVKKRKRAERDRRIAFEKLDQ